MASEALGYIGDDKAIEALTQALKDEFVGVRNYAKKAIERIERNKDAMNE